MSSGWARTALAGVAVTALLVVGAAAVARSVALHPTWVPTAGEADAAPAELPPLRFCADPNNLPFSDYGGHGFENRLASLVAGDLHRKVAWWWHPQRRGFVRKGLKEGRCDVILGVPSSFELAATTRPYYRSTYVFVTRADRRPIRSFDDPALRTMRVGVHVLGDDYASVPPAQALANRGLARQVVGYSLYGDYSKPHPPSELVDAVARGDVDVAVVWGPLAGYFAPRAAVPLHLEPVSPQIDVPFLPFVFDIAMGVRRDDRELRAALDEVLERRAPEIHRLLADYGVPFVGAAGAARTADVPHGATTPAATEGKESV